MWQTWQISRLLDFLRFKWITLANQTRKSQTFRTVESFWTNVCFVSKIRSCCIGPFTAEISLTTQPVRLHQSPLITGKATSTWQAIWLLVHASSVVKCSRRTLELFGVPCSTWTIVTLDANVLSIRDNWTVGIVAVESTWALSAGWLCCIILIISCITWFRVGTTH